MSRRLLLLATLFGAAAFGQQAIRVLNAASPSASGLAQGSLAHIEPQINPASPFVPLLRVDKPISVILRSSDGLDRIAPVLRAETHFAVMFLVPDDTPLGASTVTLRFNDRVSAPAHVKIVSASPGIYTNVQVNREGRIQSNGLTTPARPGSWITLWGTGLGNTLASNVSATVDGAPATVGYAGPAPGFPGLDQFNLYLEPGVAYAEGCYVAIEIKVGVRGAVIAANRVEVSFTHDGAPCKHHLGLTLDEMRTLDTGGSIPLAELSISRSVVPPQGRRDVFTLNESARLTVHSASTETYLLRPRGEIIAPNSCKAINSSLVGTVIIGGSPVDAGSAVTLEGPPGRIELAPGPGSYQATRDAFSPAPDPAQLPRPFFGAGTWALTAPGGRDVSPFRIEFTMPPALRLLNIGDVRVVDRTRDLTVRWDPTGFAATDEVLLTLNGSHSYSDSFSTTTGSRAVYCRAPGPQGQITIEKSLLEPFDAGAPRGEAIFPNVGLGLLLKNTLADLPLRDGGRVRTSITPSANVLVPIEIR